jgi:hypothetical protein
VESPKDEEKNGMATEKSAAILSAALAWSAAGAIVGTHACRSTPATAHAPNALAEATLPPILPPG